MSQRDDERQWEPWEQRDPSVAVERPAGEPPGYGVQYAGVVDEATTWPTRPPEPTWRVLLRRLWAPIAGLAFLLWKLKAAVFVVFKFKVFTTAASMLVSIGAYALLWGWQFGVGFVLLLLVHELGHAFEAKRQGIKASAPLFIPFLGALIALRELPKDVWREYKIAIAGPILGSLGAGAVWLAAELTDSDLLLAIAFTGFFLNLFNLLPVSPLDGGRIVAAIHPAIWGLGLLGLLVLTFVAPNPILILILLVGGLEVWRRWQQRGNPEGAEYYRVSRGRRAIAAVSYLGLAAALALAMAGTFVERDF